MVSKTRITRVFLCCFYFIFYFFTRILERDNIMFGTVFRTPSGKLFSKLPSGHFRSTLNEHKITKSEIKDTR